MHLWTKFWFITVQVAEHKSYEFSTIASWTGFSDFELKDIYVVKDSLGKPMLEVENKALDTLKKRCQNFNIHLSLSHEKNYAVAFVVIEE